MLTRYTGRPASDALILGRVVRRIAGEHRVSESTARAWLEEALEFLDRCAAADTMLEPTREADRAWHAFILHTREYEAYCLERFGRFIHHEPYDEPVGRSSLFRRGRRKEKGGCGGGGAEGAGIEASGDGGGGCGGGCGGGS